MGDIFKFTGRNLRKFRKMKGLVQSDVASKLNMSQSAYAKIESGHTALDVKRLVEVSEFLEVPINDFFPNLKFSYKDKEYCQVEFFYADGRELLKLKNEQINQMQSEIDFLRLQIMKK